MFVRKVIQLGRSLGVTIPKEYLETIGVRKGELVVVRMATPTHIVIQRHEVEKMPTVKWEDRNEKDEG